MEALPAARQQLRETLGELRLGVFAVVLTAGMTVILSFNLVWPMKDLRSCGMQKIERFVAHRLKAPD